MLHKNRGERRALEHLHTTLEQKRSQSLICQCVGQKMMDICIFFPCNRGCSTVTVHQSHRTMQNKTARTLLIEARSPGRGRTGHITFSRTNGRDQLLPCQTQSPRIVGSARRSWEPAAAATA